MMFTVLQFCMVRTFFWLPQVKLGLNEIKHTSRTDTLFLSCFLLFEKKMNICFYEKKTSIYFLHRKADLFLKYVREKYLPA